MLASYVVKGSIIEVYDDKEIQALDTLRHEFLDYLMSRPIEYYKDVTNSLIQLINRKAYGKKEEIIEGILRLLKPGK